MWVLFFFALLSPSCSSHVVFLLDTSGSMRGHESLVVNGVNKVLQDMQDTYNKLQSTEQYKLLFYAFSDSSKRLIMEGTFASQLSVDNYVTGGGTPLFDVIVETIGEVPDRSTIVIATDGEDTTSSKFSRSETRRAILAAKENRDIDFVFVANGMEAFNEAEAIGVRQAVNIAGFENFAGSASVPCSASVFRYENKKE